MIIINYTTINNGNVLAHLHCQVSGKVYCQSSIFLDNDQATQAVEKWLAQWMHDSLMSFLNHRQLAFEQVNAPLEYRNVVANLMQTIRGQKSYDKLCRTILNLQDSIRLVTPPPTSAHHYWGNIIENIIHHAHQITNPKPIRPLSRPAQFADKAGAHMASNTTSNQ